MDRETLMLALAMSLDEAATVLTLAEEPELLLEPGEPAPFIPQRVINAARIVSDWNKPGAVPTFH
jgi:hypothetical protein